jgi:beta-galactosidase
LDNIELKTKRSDGYNKIVNPMLNIGAMVQYRLADSSANPLLPNTQQGGIVLCNLKFLEKESVAENAVKKRNILATILRNLDAKFEEEKK